MRAARAAVGNRDLSLRGPAGGTAARRLVALGGVALLGSLFLPWYGRAVIQIVDGPAPWLTGWQAFRLADGALAGVAGCGLALVAVERLRPARRVRGAYLVIALASWVAVAAVIASAFGSLPGENIESPPGTPFVGWLAGLAGAGAMALGSTWAGVAER